MILPVELGDNLQVVEIIRFIDHAPTRSHTGLNLGEEITVQITKHTHDLVAFFLYLDIFYQPVRILSNAWEQIQGSLAGADRVADLMEEQPELQNFPDAIPLEGRAGGNISFQDVNFSVFSNPIFTFPSFIS